MILGVPKEILEKERRVAAIPETVEKLVAMGFQVLVESSAGVGALRSDEEYQKVGAEIVNDAETLFARSQVILKVKQPTFNKTLAKHEVELMPEGTILLTFLHPAAPSNRDMVRLLQKRSITALTMDGIPRISRAQPMDALTSMSTITGYKSVLLAANAFPRFIPLIGTAIGAIKAAKFLIIGAGVVGLQAIATAKRLGGSIKVVDINEDARKGADSLGAKVAGFDVPRELAVAEGGYAKTLPPEWLDKEREALRPLAAEADIVILSALVPGEVAPVLITDDMLTAMKPGSVVVDVAIDQGGNCAASEAGTEIVKHGVCVSALANIPGSMPVDATWLYANNMLHYVENLFKHGLDQPDWADEIVKHTLVTQQGKLVHAGALKVMSAE